jgi:hypothetical protein
MPARMSKMLYWFPAKNIATKLTKSDRHIIMASLNFKKSIGGLHYVVKREKRHTEL